MNSTTMSATPSPSSSDDDHGSMFDDLVFNGTSFDMPHGSYYPQFFYDDHHDHDHYHDIPMTTTTTTTTEAPPKPKPMYARYQLLLLFNYGHLAFAFWFIMYIIWLMMKAVGRHKVRVLSEVAGCQCLMIFYCYQTRLPNHVFVKKREIQNPMAEKEAEIDLIYSYVTKQLSNFSKKYQN